MRILFAEDDDAKIYITGYTTENDSREFNICISFKHSRAPDSAKTMYIGDIEPRRDIEYDTNPYRDWVHWDNRDSSVTMHFRLPELHELEHAFINNDNEALTLLSLRYG